MLLAPVVALVPGGAAWLVAAVGSRAGLGALTCAVAAAGVLALTTRGLHLDGLADTADGLAASYQRERALEVMRRGDTGPAGTAAVVLTVLLQVSALAQILAAAREPALAASAVLVAAVAGRVVLPLACVRGVPAARPDGLGATVAGSVPVPALLLIAVLAAAACAALSGTSGPAHPLPAALAGALAVPSALLAGGLLIRRAVTRLGGITGDVLGAGVETGTAAALLVLAAAS